MPEEQAPASQPTPDRDVFISYASQDAAVTNTLVETLERHGLRCWIAPRDVKAGAQYADAIVRALSDAKAFVLVLSEHSIASAHVSREIERAAAKKRPILAWRIDAAPLTPAMEYFLGESQWIEAHPGKTEAAYTRLIEAIREPGRSAPTHTAAATSSATHPPSRRKRLLFMTGLAVVAATLAALYVPRFWSPARGPRNQSSSVVTPTATVSDKSIAVLPFVDMSEKHDQEYFSDGLSEELIDHLAHIPDLKVIARTSSFAFKGKNEDMRSIAAKLGVANLLEGSVRKAGGELRITVQLIRASDGVHLWSEIYDRKLADIFKVQGEISTTVAKALNVALTSSKSGRDQPVSKGTTDIAAYNLMLQGKYFFDRSNKGDDTRALEHFQQALTLDPNYAVAWAKLARVYQTQEVRGELSAAEALAKGRDAVERALAIDPNSAEAYFARGNSSRIFAGDWAAAMSDYERAAALDPRGEVGDYAHRNALILKGSMSGRFGDAIDWERRYLERNPLDTTVAYILADLQRFAGQLDESAATFRKSLELNPAYATEQAQYALTLLLMGKNAGALAAAEKESDQASKLQALACIYWSMGRRAESDAALGALERGFADRDPSYEIAQIHAYRGETDAAFTWLDRAYQERKGALRYMKVDPFLGKLHGDPRFNALLRKTKLSK